MLDPLTVYGACDIYKTCQHYLKELKEGTLIRLNPKNKSQVFLKLIAINNNLG